MRSYTAPDIRNLFVGHGVVFFDRFDANGLPTGLRDLGNCPAFTSGANVEVKDHWTSRENASRKDEIFNYRASLMGKFTLEEFDVKNLALSLLGTLTGADTINHLKANKIQIRGRLEFIGEPMHGPKVHMYFWTVNLRPTNQPDMLSEDWSKMEFEFEVVRDATHSGNEWGLTQYVPES